MMGEAASCIEQPGPPKRDLQLSNKAEPRPPALFRHGGNLSPRLWNGYRREWSGVAIAGGQRVRIGSTLDLDDLAEARPTGAHKDFLRCPTFRTNRLALTRWCSAS